jgi:hypothetical protein
MRHLDIEQLQYLPKMSDPNKITVMKIIIDLAVPAFLVNEQLTSLPSYPPSNQTNTV